MRRSLATVVIFSALCAAVAMAEIDNQVLKDSAGGFSIKVPSGWRVSEQPSFPGISVWLRRTTPLGTIWISSEPVDKDLICSWPPACRNPNDSIASNYACAVETQLRNARVTVSRLKWDPKAIPSTDFATEWLNYSTRTRAVRQAFMVNAQHAVTITLAAPNATTLKSHLRDFEQMLRTIRAIKNEPAPTPSGSGAAPAAGSGADAKAATPNAPGSNAGSAAPAPAPPAAGSNASDGSDATKSVGSDEDRLAELYQSNCDRPTPR